MKIGIFTFYQVLNYGAVLQAYALQKVLQELGYEAFVINYQPKELTRPYKTILLKNLKHLSYIAKLWRRAFLFRSFHTFIKKYLYEGIRYNSYKQIKENAPAADVYIVGSDQVWNTKHTGGDDIFFLPFSNKGVVKIAYAASCGGHYSFLGDLGKLEMIMRFDAISVREKSLQIELENISILSEVVLDPTLLLKNYDEFIGPNKHGNYIVVYNIINSSDFLEKLSYLKKEVKIPIINIGPNHIREADKNLLGVSPSEWVNLLFHAKYIITNSFHGVAFSINFKKRFFYIPLGTASDSRVLDLLNSIGLQKNASYSYPAIDVVLNSEENNFENDSLSNMKQASLNFLKKAICKR